MLAVVKYAMDANFVLRNTMHRHTEHTAQFSCCSAEQKFQLHFFQATAPTAKSWTQMITFHDLWSHSAVWIYILRHKNTRLTALGLGLPGWAGTKKVKAIWILLKQETVSGSGISWAVCKSAHRSRQITMPALYHSVFYRQDALPVAQPTESKHWRHNIHITNQHIYITNQQYWKSHAVTGWTLADH